MIKGIFVFIFVFLTISALHAQTFKGQILDRETKQPVPFAEVFYVDLNTGTIADVAGNFTVAHFEQQNIRMQISSLGYRTLDTIVNVLLTPSTTHIFYLTPSHYQLEEVIVSAPAGKLGKQSIVSVEKRSISQLQEIPAPTLAESIGNIPGVEQNSTGVGIGKPVIRGLSGNRIVTYAQGMRIENQQWGDEHGLGVGEIGIGSVEVIKGPASLLYGSDALGGVLYFVDEHYADHNTVEASVKTRYLSSTLGSMNDFGFKIHRGGIKFNLFGAYNTHGDYQVPNQQYVYNTRFDEKNIKSSLGFNTDHWVSNIRYSYLQNNFGISDTADYRQTSERSFELPFQTIDNHNLSFENLFFIKDSKLSTVIGHTSNYRREFEDDINHQALGLKLNSTTYNVKWNSTTYHNRFDFVLGSQGMLQTNKNNGEEILIPDASKADVGLFGLGNYHFKDLHLQGGVRIDQRKITTEAHDNVASLEKTYQGITFSGGAVYTKKKMRYRANFASGFRAPNTAELLANGVHEGTNRFELGNASLTNEQASQIDFSIDYQSEHLQFSINPFYNYISNYIYLSPTDTIIASNPVFEYVQTNAFLTGGEMGIHYHPHAIHGLHLASILSTVYAEDQLGRALPLIPQTKLSSDVSYEFKGKKQFRISKVNLQYIYKFRQDRIGQFETTSPAYSLLNAGVKMKYLNKNFPLEMTVGAKNLLNQTYIDHLSRFKTLGIPNQGINFFVELKMTIKGKLKGKVVEE